MPTNIFGIGDNFNPTSAHVIPGLINKFHEAKVSNLPNVEVWGTGMASREFIYAGDVASGLVFLMNNYDSPEIINVGTGTDISIKELALLISFRRSGKES